MAETSDEAVVQKTTHVGEETSKDGYDWLKKSNKNLHSSLVELDSSLECPICYDYFRIPVSLSRCQHSFCSECIRATFKAQMKLVMKNCGSVMQNSACLLMPNAIPSSHDRKMNYD